MPPFRALLLAACVWSASAAAQPPVPLAALVPETGPYGSYASVYVPTFPSPADALAADFLRPDGRHLGALLTVAPVPGYAPADAFAVFAGGVPSTTRPVMIDGTVLDLVTVTQPDGAVAYAVAFAASTDGRVLPLGPQAPSTDDLAVHVVARAETEDAAAGLAAASLARLTDAGALARETPPVPDLAAPVAFPNPFAGATTLTFDLAVSTEGVLAVYDALGRRVAVLAEGPFAAGRHTVPFVTNGRPPGLYVVRLRAGGQTAARRITLMR